MNILITGSSGFIGYNLCNYLLKKKFKIFGVDNYFSGSKTRTKKLLKEFENFRFFEVDIRDNLKLDTIFKKVDVVINLAGQVSVQRSFSDVLENDSINSQGFINILNLCLKNEIKNLIFASSCSVYGESNIIPIGENISLDPKSPYAISKISNEEYSRLFGKLDNELVITGLRFFNVVGPWQSVNSDYGAVIPRWINSFFKNEIPIIFGDGNATRDFVDVYDLSRLIEKIITSKKKYSYEIFNLGSGNELKITDLFKIMMNVMKSHNIKFSFSKPKFEKKREGDILRSLSDNSKISKMFDYKDFIDIDKSISRIISEQYGEK